MNAIDIEKWMFVKLDIEGSTLLGQVRDLYHDDDGNLHCVVHHFNGEPWPVPFSVTALEVI